jgi:protein phosphatase 2C family protein 2/3
MVKSKNIIDKSGSCALISIIIGDTVYVCNLGDSRAILIHRGRSMQLTEDHKPSCSR